MKTLLTMTSRGAITLPARLRQALGLKADDELIAETTPEGLLLRPAITLPIELYSEKRVREFDQAEEQLERLLGKKKKRPMPSAVLTSKGQITIPKEVRDALGVRTGDRIELVETANGAFEIVAVSKDVRRLKRMIAAPRKPVTVEEMRKAVARRAGR